MTVRRLLVVLPALSFLLVVTASGAAADHAFEDVGSTGHDAVDALVTVGVVHGCDDERFCSDDELTRGQVASVLVEALELPPAVDGEVGRFSDTQGSVHGASIDALAAAGLSAGCGNGRFCPDDPIERGQLATMLQAGFDLPDAPDEVRYFADADGFHRPGIRAVAAAGISTGCDLIEFCPGQALPRVHAAVFVARAMELVEPASLDPFEERQAAYEERLAEEEAAAQAAAEAEAERRAAQLAPGEEAVEVALAQLGKPYRWGGSGPGSFDCSGLTAYAWAAVGVNLPHNSGMQYRATTRISRSELRPGDLVFYHSPISHVAMYIGDGKVVEAPNSGNQVRIREDGLTRRGVVGFGRP